jgi:hypothetical protein
MGQNRRWLKLFFYLLEAGTSNALVIYNEAMKGKEEPFNIADYKTKVVEALVGGKLKEGSDNMGAPEHTMIQIANGELQRRCSYCAATGLYHRTRYIYGAGCGVPYCSIGSGKAGQDCFAMAHDNKDICQLCVQK